MSSTTPAPTPAPTQEDSEHINIRVCSADGSETFFKIKRSTPLRKLMDAYCKRQGLSRDSVRFTFDGNRIGDNETADTLEMDQNDSIDCLVEQTGGF
eukprot:CAMPEP_0117439286 /NCGR_PEP_ID=MMETSP0759-20121206/2488_1 /TAXON_ID=63605 /ORGANISM="Percolomonas cosmopolitus, Strain WS" /LENGTH=96 /DNA_ID=CAMNT_0005230999 /DNA_START=142 /DNA_END=432 /DNA_ORIENTATION=+